MRFSFPASWLLSGLLAFASVSCQKKDEAAPEPEAVQLRYTQTYCADRWGSASGTQQAEAAATAYLLQQGITAKVVAQAINPPTVCNACSCTTGVVLVASVRPSDAPALLALGFTQ
ncbi:hypothetical protein [Hymenobacter psychrotolerans]|uniref:Metal-binding protein n=1 Tax=Hymenobacter psychrotolerans DSM 18569 TaxID=1121959 RepID=A0A1M7GAZ1_9BACT|nr:hypothetical protein [Hymenobacter psychrotolerans]SHM13443.1 hypothetical protein SAMN02746009_03998 [Hymenobacter psychrotolerans DSM 18569]